jgi:cysteine desulfurase
VIYLDHAATAPLERAVLEEMWPYLTGSFGNPSSHHAVGQQAAAAVDRSRERVAAVLGCRPAEVIFTGSGTEAANLAVKGVALANPRGRHLITSAVEHKAVLEAMLALARHNGFDVTILPVDRSGLVDVAAVAAAVRPDTTLVSLMYANNEVGTIEPVVEVAAVCHDAGVPFHTDAVQAVGHLSLSVGADLLSLSAHKFGGPKGVGALFARRGIPLVPLVDGGGQERGRRSGTENVAGAVGLAAALELAEADRAAEAPRLMALRDRLIDTVLASVPAAVLTGHRTQRLPHHASFCFEGVAGEAVLLELEMEGVCCSSGSACAAGSQDPSHVLTAMGIPADLAQTAVRFTMGPGTTADEVDEVARLLPLATARVRSLAETR